MNKQIHTRQKGSSARWPKQLFRGFKNMYSVKDGIALAPQQNWPSSTAPAKKSYSSQHTFTNKQKHEQQTHTMTLKENVYRMIRRSSVSRLWYCRIVKPVDWLWKLNPLTVKKIKKNRMVKRPSVKEKYILNTV